MYPPLKRHYPENIVQQRHISAGLMIENQTILTEAGKSYITLNGYNEQGLPFQLAFVMPESQLEKFNANIAKLMAVIGDFGDKIKKLEAAHTRRSYSRYYLALPNQNTAVNNLIDNIQATLKANDMSHISTSVAMTYQGSGRKFLAGFACGEAGVLTTDSVNKMRATNSIELQSTRVARSQIYGLGSNLTDADFQEVKIKRCQQFNIQMKANSNIVCFAKLPSELKNSDQASTYPSQTAGFRIIETPFNDSLLSSGSSLNEEINMLVAKSNAEKCVYSAIAIEENVAQQKQQEIIAHLKTKLSKLGEQAEATDPRKEIIANVIAQTEKLSQDPSEYADVIRTYVVMDDVLTVNSPENIARLSEQAKSMDRASSAAHVAISVGLFALAAVSIIVGLALIVTGVGFVAGLVMIPLGAMLANAGIINALTASELHATHTSRLFGVTKQLNNLAEEQEKLTVKFA